jgi:hypothetical protein
MLRVKAEQLYDRLQKLMQNFVNTKDDKKNKKQLDLFEIQLVDGNEETTNFSGEG